MLAAALQDYRRLLAVLHEQGRFSATVSIMLDGVEAAEMPLTRQPPPMRRAVVRVIPGPVFRLGAVSVAPLPPGAAPVEGFAPGKPALPSVVRHAVAAALEGWRAAGHAQARVIDRDLIADHARAVLAVRVRIDPGPLVRIGRLRVTGESAVRSERIAAIAGLPEGRIFSPDALERAAARLRRSGAFATVAITEPDKLRPGGVMDPVVSVIDAPPRRIGAGAELSSTDGLALSGFWLHRNLLGGAERFRAEGRVAGIGGGTGGIDSTLRMRLDIPAVRGPDTHGFLGAEARELDEVDFASRSRSLGAGLSRRFSDSLTGELGLELSWSRSVDALGIRQDRLLSFPGTLAWDRRNDPLEPERGHYLRLDARPFLALSATGSGMRATLDARIYRAFGAATRELARGRPVLAARLRAGTLLGVGTAAARSEFLFHSGGGGTVRGQPYQSLGVDLGGGASRGGLSFLGLSLEARMPVRARLGVVAFVDAGHVGRTALPGSAGAWHAGAGLGVRLATPFGPIRADLAAPVAGTTGRGLQLYLGIGQSF